MRGFSPDVVDFTPSSSNHSTVSPPTTTTTTTSTTTTTTSSNAKSITLLNNIKIDYDNEGNQTKFLVTSPLGADVDPTNAWLGFGLNSIQKMVEKIFNLYWKILLMNLICI